LKGTGMNTDPSTISAEEQALLSESGCLASTVTLQHEPTQGSHFVFSYQRFSSPYASC
jgi:hypothetical protein